MTLIETAIALTLGHVLADFTMQSDRMVQNKRDPLVLLAHVAIVAAVSWAALGFAPRPVPILVIALSHYAIDWIKLRHGGPGFTAFAADQAAHLAMIGLAATLSPDAWSAGLWGLALPGAAEWHMPLPAAMTLAAGLLAAVWAGGYAVQALMHGLKYPLDPAEDESLPRGGQLIGRLERLMIFMLVLAGQAGAIGFLIAAKSVLRFNELARDRELRIGEYVIIGTLASFAWGIGIAFATVALLARLAGT